MSCLAFASRLACDLLFWRGKAFTLGEGETASEDEDEFVSAPARDDQ